MCNRDFFMIEYSDLRAGQVLYLVEDNPVCVLELTIKSIIMQHTRIPKIKITNDDISFEIEFDFIADRAFTDKDLAYFTATKHIFDKTNKYIRELTDGRLNDYFDLDNAIEKQKGLHPHRFI